MNANKVIKELDRKAQRYNNEMQKSEPETRMWWYWYGKTIATNEAIDTVMR